MVEKFGRRKCLAIAASWQCVAFLIYASLGQFALNPSGDTSDFSQNNQTVGYLMIVFACLFIFSFAATWGPMVGAEVGMMRSTKH
jgi:SP family sugar:H+ symporter-like MFS transporter